MNNNWLKKLVGAALALAFVVSSAFIPGLSFNAGAAVGDVQSTGFESSTGTITGSSTAASRQPPAAIHLRWHLQAILAGIRLLPFVMTAQPRSGSRQTRAIESL